MCRASSPGQAPGEHVRTAVEHETVAQIFTERSAVYDLIRRALAAPQQSLASSKVGRSGPQQLIAIIVDTGIGKTDAACTS